MRQVLRGTTLVEGLPVCNPSCFLCPAQLSASGESVFQRPDSKADVVEDGFNNVRGEKSALQNSAHLTIVHAEFLGKDSLTGDFPSQYPFVPGAPRVPALSIVTKPGTAVPGRDDERQYEPH